SGQALARRFVEKRHSLRLERGLISIDARCLQAKVMQSFAALGEEARHPRVFAGGLEELDFTVSRGEEGRAHALVGNLRLADQRQPQRVTPERVCSREASNHDADVVDVLDHVSRQPRLSAWTALTRGDVPT